MNNRILANAISYQSDKVTGLKSSLHSTRHPPNSHKLKKKIEVAEFILQLLIKESDKNLSYSIVKNLDTSPPLYKEFCYQKGLKDGDIYASTDYIFWAKTLSADEQAKVLLKYGITL